MLLRDKGWITRPELPEEVLGEVFLEWEDDEGYSVFGDHRIDVHFCKESIPVVEYYDEIGVKYEVELIVNEQ